MIVLLVCLTSCLMVLVACGVGVMLAQPHGEPIDDHPGDDHPWFAARAGARPSDLRFQDPGRVRLGGFAPTLADPRRVDRP
jgi:hypothetical protein